jgi:hypothetical protein
MSGRIPFNRPSPAGRESKGFADRSRFFRGQVDEVTRVDLERFGGRRGDCPVAEDVSDRLLRLPFLDAMSGDELGETAGAVVGFDGFRG